MSTAPDLDPGHVQRIVAYSYHLQFSRHFVLRVSDPGDARAFLATLVKRGLVTNASLNDDEVLAQLQRGDCPLNIGFTYRGLEALELPKRFLRVFQEKAPAFAEGARPRAARRLADTGASAVRWWEDCFKQDHAHVLLTLHADDTDSLDSFTKELEALPEAGGLGDWKQRFEGMHLTQEKDRRTVHFGLRDGVSNPAIRGFPPERKKKTHEPGEFLLGHANNGKFNPWLLIDPSPSPWASPRYRLDRQLFWNGSFAAFRKMEQHEKEFNDYVAKWGKRFVSEDYVRAKITGRWDNGRLIRPGEVERPPDPPAGADLDDFDFSRDRKGEGCPFGSHIRRMNPRNDPIVPLRQRPLIRRGMPYGRKYAEDPVAERGLLGLFFCASLEDQFEHLLAEWGDANPMGPRNRGTSKDPFIGGYGGPGAPFDIPMADRTLRQLEDFTSFVTTRGTLYAFFPGLPGLEVIARAGGPAA